MNLRDWPRRANEKALYFCATKYSNLIHLFGGFNALSDSLNFEALRQINNCANYNGRIVAIFEAYDKTAVNLDLTKWKTQ